jgi:putative flippase GtrA
VQFFEYSTGGLLYFWVAWAIITFGTARLGLFWANLLGNSIGIFLNFLVQRFWAFEAKGKHIFNSGWRFGVLTAANLLLSYFVLKVLSQWLHIPLWAAQFVSAALFTGWNWFWYRNWVFKEGRE